MQLGRPRWGFAPHLHAGVRTYLTTDKEKTFCVYDGPSPEAIRAAAELNGLPVDAISEVPVLDPYFYVEPAAV